ncbi:ATP-dependent helicase HrpB [Nitrospira sp. KM1]|uniref:ATP-dependent helicase HrpB n=1 Tax=Nitrospira sp. KM1 TaxID=1936990 RepID=UPI001566F918|nr:ATP-dependent helicase HrpB [Nitrospira sp. KM1]
MSGLPIEDVLPSLEAALQAGANAVLTAPPGAGKTTRVPLALLDSPWRNGKVLVLEPRRLAARAAAQRMAAMLKEPVGASVGYRMRFDTNVGSQTRIEVVTEGILTRMLQHDPSLEGYGAVLFDEFHERSLQADTGLALCMETQRLFRPDLRLLVMSATLDCGPIGQLLGHASAIHCEGRLFHVDIRYLDGPSSVPTDLLVTQTIRRSLAEDQGSLLVFLPGMAEIRQVERRLRESAISPTVHIAPLHGDLPVEAQDLAIAPSKPGTRKVVLATSIAETSLTIDGIRVVIDAGRLRVPRYDPRSGLSRLATIPVTQDSADQRAGRAGRLEPGICYRLWTEKEQATLSRRRPPEILDADLTPLLLDLALWGAEDVYQLAWLTPPPAASVAHARDLLTKLGALDPAGHITTHGAHMAELPVHPRLSHMMLRSIPMQLPRLACEVAALLGERDMLRSFPQHRTADLRARLDLLHGRHEVESRADRGTLQRIIRTAELWQRYMARNLRGQGMDPVDDTDQLGLLLALAYPDRIARKQAGDDRRYVLANGRGAMFAHPDPLSTEPYLVIAALDAGTDWARIDLAAPISLPDIESLYGSEIVEREEVMYDERAGAVRASKQRRLGMLVLSEQALSQPDSSLITTALLDAVRREGIAALDWTTELKQWRARVQFLRRVKGAGADWPDLSDEALLQTLYEWLAPYLDGITTLDRVKRLDLSPALHGLMDWEQRRRLDQLAPTHITVPSGSSIRLDYETTDLPVLPVRLQEMFGCRETPRIAGGEIPVVLHLLSPAKRPVQVTKDLASFWRHTYQEVRKELRGRYPKHHWPEDPLVAQPTAKTKRRS